jgi:hypothetical protein
MLNNKILNQISRYSSINDAEVIGEQKDVQMTTLCKCIYIYLITLIGLDVELAGKRVEQLVKLETHQGQPVLKIK